MPTLELLWWETMRQSSPLPTSAGEKSERPVPGGVAAPLAPTPRLRWDFMRPETRAEPRQAFRARER
jgi:hypothetical protein